MVLHTIFFIIPIQLLFVFSHASTGYAFSTVLTELIIDVIYSCAETSSLDQKFSTLRAIRVFSLVNIAAVYAAGDSNIIGERADRKIIVVDEKSKSH